MNFSTFTATVLAVLKKKEFSKDENNKDTLTAEDKEQLKLMGFSETFISGYSTALENGFKEEKEDPNPKNPGSHSSAVITGLLAEKTSELAALQQQYEAIQKENGENQTALSAKEQEITGLKEKIGILSAAAEEDTGSGSQHGKSPKGEGAFDWKDEKQAGGMEGVMFALEDRPYNQRLQAAMLFRQGIASHTPVASTIDYQRLKEDLGAFYRIPWQDRLQSFLMKLPTIETIFPLESGYQDLAVLTNIWLGEFSQADNTSSDFDQVTKGSYEFDTETLRMYSIMFAHKFRDLKELERTWIGNYNKEGSQVVKWSFVEYILAETAKKLHNERELRRINGVRKDPDLNKAGRAMEAADGVYEFLNKKINGHIDINNGKFVYQVKPFPLGEITPENIGERLFKGTSMIPDYLRDSGSFALYIPSFMIVWYHKYNELRYGLNQDYKADLMYVKEYPSVKLIPVPNADNHHRIFWTMEGNVRTFEHVPGEMTRFSLEQQDWTLKVWSNWKESIWATAVGFKYTKKDDMDYSRQMIFANEYDRPSYYFVGTEPDKNPSAKVHTSIVTAANRETFEITDVEGADVGKVISLKCGSVDKGVVIKVADKFSLLSGKWEPAKGDIIKLMKRSDGKFIEIARVTSATDALQFPSDTQTPSLLEGTEFVTGINTAATEITNLLDTIPGQVYTLYGNGDQYASVIKNGGNFVLTKDMTLKTGTFIQLVKSSDAKFYETSRG